jgi:HEPN domain-containing protein
MDLNNAVHEWFEIAKQDLQSAKTLKKFQHPTPVESVCFHCQQSAEKYLKGYLALNGTVPPKTHDLNVLGNMCVSIDKVFANWESNLRFLKTFAVLPRYPKELDISDSEMNKAIVYAERIEKDVFALAKEKGYISPRKDPHISI